MDTEIELKLLVNKDDYPSLIDYLNQHPQLINQYQSELMNLYFDTPDGVLREAACGLRVRSSDGHHEQTLKTRGQMVGGVHQRPEFNITIDGHRPELLLFPDEAWPAGLDPQQLQAQLVSLFETNFTRRTWILQFPDNSLVEVVLDVGKVLAGEREEPISELECELVKGDLQCLLELAQQFNELFSVRLGGASKAARGYRLMTGEAIPETRPLKQLPLPAQPDLEAFFETLLSVGISHLQYHEEAIHRGGGIRAWCELRNALRLLEWGFSVLQDLLPESGLRFLPALRQGLAQLEWVPTASCRDRLLRHKEQFMKRLDDKRALWRLIDQHDSQPQREGAEQWLSSASYNDWVLQLTGWLLSKSWLQGDNNEQWQGSVMPLARQELEASQQQLQALFPADKTCQAADFVTAQQTLERSLLTGFCFRALFEPEAENSVRGPWQDMLRGCRELAVLDFIEHSISGSELADNQQIQRWLERKRSSWVELLMHSRDAALALPAYWHDDDE